MDKYNIEVGDKPVIGDNSTIKGVYDWGVSFINNPVRHEYTWERINSLVEKGAWKPVTKMSKSKIIGYTLLKDTPEFNAGQVFESAIADDNGDTIYVPSSGKYENNDSYWYSVEDVSSKPEWFSPIYEEVKPTEVFVDTLAGKVKVTKDKVRFTLETSQPGESITTSKALEFIAKVKSWQHPNMSFDIKVETFKVGCKTFHISDLDKISEAIKQVS